MSINEIMSINEVSYVKDNVVNKWNTGAYKTGTNEIFINTYSALWSRDHLIDLQITNLIDIYN